MADNHQLIIAAENHQFIIAAKVVILERLVRALYKEAFLNEPGVDPIKAIEGYANAIIGDMEQATAEDSEEARIVTLENLTIFFDRLRADIQTAVDDRGSATNP